MDFCCLAKIHNRGGAGLTHKKVLSAGAERTEKTMEPYESRFADAAMKGSSHMGQGHFHTARRKSATFIGSKARFNIQLSDKAIVDSVT